MANVQRLDDLTATQTAITPGTTTLMMAANKDRIAAIIANESGGKFWYAWTNSAPADDTTMFPLADGGSIIYGGTGDAVHTTALYVRHAQGSDKNFKAGEV